MLGQSAIELEFQITVDDQHLRAFFLYRVQVLTVYFLPFLQLCQFALQTDLQLCRLSASLGEHILDILERSLLWDVGYGGAA